MSFTRERRGAPRAPVSVQVQQHVAGQSHRCTATDLSRTGLYMERPLATFVRQSCDVMVEIPLPDGRGEPILTPAEIVYDSFDALLHGTAVRFKGLSTNDQARIDAWLAQNAPPAASASTAAA